jgi:O-acetyl-ADP-ribose deacetylase (regulator of RNase III)
MIEITRGDILRDGAEALVNSVNCVGIMGRGIALQFKREYPDNFRAYAEACKREDVQPGRLFVYVTGQLTGPRYIINFPTKRHWRGRSRMEDIEAGLRALVEEIRRRKITTIAIPPLGAGEGGLEWADVRPRIEAALSHLPDVQIRLYEPIGAPRPENMAHIRAVPRMTAGRAALVELMRRYLDGLLDPFITLLEVHKLMYFLQEAGEPLKLRFSKAPYGPYGENLRHVLNIVEGHLIYGYADGGDAPDKQLKLVPGALNEAASFIDEHQDTRERLDRVASLIGGFESPFGMELLSTVHWVLSREEPDTQEQLVERIYAWNDRKRQFMPRQIALAADVLADHQWARPLRAGTGPVAASSTRHSAGLDH